MANEIGGAIASYKTVAQPRKRERGRATRIPDMPAGRKGPAAIRFAPGARFSRRFPVLVDFYADWCGPCKMLAPTLETLAGELADARIVKVNVDHNPELAMRYGVNSIPSLAVFKGGEVTAEHVGLASKGQLKELLRQ